MRRILWNFYCQYKQTNESKYKELCDWNYKDFMVSILAYFLKNINTDNIDETKVSYLVGFLLYINKYYKSKNYTGQQFIDYFNDNTKGYGLNMLTQVCKSSGMKAGKFTRVKTVLIRWSNELSQNIKQYNNQKSINDYVDEYYKNRVCNDININDDNINNNDNNVNNVNNDVIQDMKIEQKNNNDYIHNNGNVGNGGNIVPYQQNGGYQHVPHVPQQQQAQPHQHGNQYPIMGGFSNKKKTGTDGGQWYWFCDDHNQYKWYPYRLNDQQRINEAWNNNIPQVICGNYKISLTLDSQTPNGHQQNITIHNATRRQIVYGSSGDSCFAGITPEINPR